VPGRDARPDWVKQAQAESGHTLAEGRWFVKDPRMPSFLRSFLGIVAPQLRSKYARQKANEINAAHGEFNRVKDQILNSVDPHNETFNTLQVNEPQRLRAIVNRLQGGDQFPDFQPTRQEAAAMDANAAGFKRWRDLLQREGVLDRFIDEYLPGMYKDQEKAREMMAQFRARGHGGPTLEKMFNNYEQAMAAGLTPKTMNPNEMLRCIRRTPRTCSPQPPGKDLPPKRRVQIPARAAARLVADLHRQKTTDGNVRERPARQPRPFDPRSCLP